VEMPTGRVRRREDDELAVFQDDQR
jgi:hypothetical protein